MAEDYNRELELNGEKLADNIAERILSGFENKIGGLSEGIAKAGEKAVQKGVKELSQKLSQTEIKIGDNSFFINYDEKKISKQVINQIDKIAKKINKYAEDAFNFPEKSKTLGSLQRTQGTLLPFDDDAIKLRTKGLTTKNIEQLLNKMDSDTKSKTEKIIGNIAQVLEFRDRAVAGLKDSKPSDIFDIHQVTMYADSLKDVIRSSTVLADLFKELEKYGITSSSFSKRIKIDGFQNEAQNLTKEFEDYKARTTSSWLSMITGASTPEKGITERKANQIINNHKLLLSAKKSDGNYIKVDDIRSEARAKVLSERSNAIVEKYMQMAMDELESNLSDAFNKATNGKSNTDFVKLYNAYLARGGKQKEKYDEYNNSAAVQTNTLDYYVIEALRKKNEKPTTAPSIDTVETTRKAAKQAESDVASTAGAIAEQSEKTKQKVTDDANQAANNAQRASQETKDKTAADQQAIRDEHDKTKKKADEVNNETKSATPTPTESKKTSSKGTAKKTSSSKKGSSKKSTTKKSVSDTSNDQNVIPEKPVSPEEIKNIEGLDNAVKTVTQSVDLKNKAFQLERQIVENATNSESEALLQLSNAIIAIERSVKDCDKAFEHLSEYKFDLKILSDEELQKFKNLSSELEGLNKVFENIGKISTSDNIASKIDEIATSIGNLKDKFEGFPESGVNVFSELNSLAAHKDTLKDLAKVLSASSKQIEEAKKQATNTPDPPARPANGKIIKSKVNNLNNSWEDTYIDDIGKLHVVGQKTNNNGVARNIDHEVTSYKELETTAVRILKKIIKTSEELKLAQMEINPDQGYIDSLINKQQTLRNIYKDILKVAKSYSDAEGSKYSLNNFFSSVKSKVTTDREDSRVRVAKKTPLIATKNEKKIVDQENVYQLKSKINQLKASMNDSGADTTLLANQLDYLEKSLNNVSDTDAFDKIKSKFNTLSQQFRELNSSFKADQDAYSDQISVIDDLMKATTALNNTQTNQMINPDKDFSETIRRQSEAVNELSVKAGEALAVVEDLYNAGGKISADQVTDARNRLTAAASGSPESQENYNTAKVKSENKAYEDATDAIKKYRDAKSKLISLKADQLSNPEKDLSKSIKEATEDVKEFGNQAREAYLNVQELAKSSSTISSDMVSSLRNGLKDSSKGSGTAQDKYNNAKTANERKQIADNLKVLKEYYDTQSKLNEFKAEQKTSNNKNRYVDEISELETKLEGMENSALSAYDAIQKLNSATAEDKATAYKYLGSDGSSKSRRKLNIAEDKQSAAADRDIYKNNLKIIEEYWNKKSELINLNAKQMNAKNGEDYSDDIEELTNALPGLEQKAKDAYNAILKLKNITVSDKEDAKKLLNEGNDHYQKAQSNFGNAYNKSEFSKEKKALKDVSDAYEEYIKKRIELNNTVSKGVDDETFNIAMASAKDAADQFKKTVDYAKSIGVLDDSIHEVMSGIDSQYYSKAEKSVINIGSDYEKQIQNVEDKLKNASDNVKSIITDIKNQLTNVLTLNDQGQPDYSKINEFGQELKSKLNFVEELNKVENFGDKIANNIEGGLGSSVGKVEEYTNELENFKKRLEEILKSLSNTPPSNIDEIDSFRDQLNSLNSEVTDFLKNKAGLKSVTGQGLLDTDSIGNVTNINDLSDALDKYVAAKKYAKLSAIDLNEATQTATVKIKDENDAVRILTASIDANAKAMRVKTGKASSTGLFKDVINSTGRYLTMMLDVGDVINFVRRNISEAVSTFKEYDDALTNISYTMNMAQEDLENLGQSAINMAEDLSMSIQDAASIYQIYANMNTTAAEIEKTAMPTAILSNLSGVDASTASDQVQGILQQFNMLEDESQNVADVSMHIVDVLDKISSNVAIDYANFIGTYIRNNI